MATNPMQRKARNSFLLGMLVMVLISGVVIAFLFIQLMNKNKKEQEELKASVKAYVLNKDVSSGQVITTDMLSLQTVNKNLVPSNATSDITMIQNYALQDKEGNDIYTKYDKNNNPKLYINKNNKEYEVQIEYYYTEISLSNVDKWDAIKFLITKLEIKPEEVIAIGDNINDKKMIENAGLGVVMKGSTPVVTEVADYITDSNNDEGVAKILQKYYKNINF